jgi:hypothetical protein
MKYALLVHESQELSQRRKDPAFQAAGRAYGERFKPPAFLSAARDWNHCKRRRPFRCATESVTSTTDRMQRRRNFAGFAIIEVPNLDAALEWAARHPIAGFALVEVRPLALSHFTIGNMKAS